MDPAKEAVQRADSLLQNHLPTLSSTKKHPRFLLNHTGTNEC